MNYSNTRNSHPKKVIILGSAALKIGEAGEFCGNHLRNLCVIYVLRTENRRNRQILWQPTLKSVTL